MAKLDILLPFILSWEGGFSNHPADRGGVTNKGVTLRTWRTVGCDKDADGDVDADDLRLMTDTDVRDRVLRPHYWNPWQADRILSQSVANLCVDWGWASGPVNAIRRVQALFGLKTDGMVGPKTLAALNSGSQSVYRRIFAARKEYIERLCARDRTQQVFRRGWLRRLEGIGLGFLRLNDGTLLRFEVD